jgi:hypothetical protein
MTTSACSTPPARKFGQRALALLANWFATDRPHICLWAYYRNRIANLTIGILLLPTSILSALFFLSWGLKSGFDGFIYTMTLLSVVSIALSIFLIFSYLRLSFDRDN